MTTQSTITAKKSQAKKKVKRKVGEIYDFHHKKIKKKAALFEISIDVDCNHCDNVFNLLNLDSHKNKIKDYLKCYPNKIMEVDESIKCPYCEGMVKLKQVYTDMGEIINLN